MTTVIRKGDSAEIRSEDMPRFPNYFVIVGSTIADATGKYHELRGAGDERIKGSPIRLAVAHTAIRHLQGLRVHGFEFTDIAKRHAHYEEVLDVLERSVLFGSYRNNPKTGEQ